MYFGYYVRLSRLSYFDKAVQDRCHNGHSCQHESTQQLPAQLHIIDQIAFRSDTLK